jgi:VacB/RNase II family 3'-5' exoribonuclease
MSSSHSRGREDLRELAHEAMLERGPWPDFSAAALHQADSLPAAVSEPSARNEQELLWASIDNDDSRDLDQLSVAVPLGEAACRILVAIADVDARVPRGSPLDAHARHNTTSVYTAARIFPMLPERLSTDLTSLVQDSRRLAVVVDMTVTLAGDVREAGIYRAWVCNKAKLAYSSVAAWLDGRAAPPAPVAAVAGMQEQLAEQDRIAQALRAVRHRRGALTLETIQARAVFDGGTLAGLEREHQNRAQQLIEDFMIAANETTVRWLEGRGFPTLRRVLRTPERWERIVALAHQAGERLPAAPDAAALNAFLVRRRQADPERFPELSLSVIKLLGRGEYALHVPGRDVQGHFGLAVRDYTHSTAPNRRFPDVITQRLVKAALAGEAPPYSLEELAELAGHCTQAEDCAAKVERRIAKSAAAQLLQKRIGERFEAIVTGASPKGTWVRLLALPVEGKVMQGAQGLDVGQRTQVRLVHTDVAHGFIDFAHSAGS